MYYVDVCVYTLYTRMHIHMDAHIYTYRCMYVYLCSFKFTYPFPYQWNTFPKIPKHIFGTGTLSTLIITWQLGLIRVEKKSDFPFYSTSQRTHKKRQEIAR